MYFICINSQECVGAIDVQHISFISPLHLWGLHSWHLHHADYRYYCLLMWLMVCQGWIEKRQVRLRLKANEKKIPADWLYLEHSWISFLKSLSVVCRNSNFPPQLCWELLYNVSKSLFLRSCLCFSSGELPKREEWRQCTISLSLFDLLEDLYLFLLIRSTNFFWPSCAVSAFF